MLQRFVKPPSTVISFNMAEIIVLLGRLQRLYIAETVES